VVETLFSLFKPLWPLDNRKQYCFIRKQATYTNKDDDQSNKTTVKEQHTVNNANPTCTSLNKQNQGQFLSGKQII
jgi:hypothetical protein